MKDPLYDGKVYTWTSKDGSRDEVFVVFEVTRNDHNIWYDIIDIDTGELYLNDVDEEVITDAITRGTFLPGIHKTEYEVEEIEILFGMRS